MWSWLNYAYEEEEKKKKGELGDFKVDMLTRD